jgi:DUF971 family protein
MTDRSNLWPTELRVSKDRQRLVVSFNDGQAWHGPSQRVTVPGKRNVAIISMTPTGNYAVRVGFDDGHDTGIFTWTYLHELGMRGDELFAAYEKDLAEKGMNRDVSEKPR